MLPGIWMVYQVDIQVYFSVYTLCITVYTIYSSVIYSLIRIPISFIVVDTSKVQFVPIYQIRHKFMKTKQHAFKV